MDLGDVSPGKRSIIQAPQLEFNSQNPTKKKIWVRWCASVIPTSLQRYARQRNRRISRSSEAYRLASLECTARAEIARETLSQRGVRWRSTAESCPETSVCALQHSFTDTHYINKSYKNYQVPFNDLKSKWPLFTKNKIHTNWQDFKNCIKLLLILKKHTSMTRHLQTQSQRTQANLSSK